GLRCADRGQPGLPAPLVVPGAETGRGRTEQAGAAVKAADLDVDGTGIAVAAALEQRRRALQGAAPQIGLDPKFRFHSHWQPRIAPPPPLSRLCRGSLTGARVSAPSGRPTAPAARR